MDKELKKDLNRELREAADIVAQDARPRLARYNARSAAGIRPRVRGGGLAVVEQRRGRVTGKRGDWGSLQMRKAFLPALASKRDQVEQRLEEMLDRLGDHNGF